MRSRAILPKLLLLLAFGCFAMATAVRAADENLAPDADFESDPSSSWFGRGPCSFTWATGVSHSPTHALRIDSDTSALCRWLSEIPAIPVNPGESYDVAARHPDVIAAIRRMVAAHTATLTPVQNQLVKRANP